MALALLGAGCAAHFGKFYRRLGRRPPFRGRHLAASLAAVPAIVVTGDAAKMCGFPVGLFERATGAAGPRSSTQSGQDV
jgi:hypothetical protein